MTTVLLNLIDASAASVLPDPMNPLPADDELHAAALDGLGADIDVGGLDGGDHCCSAAMLWNRSLSGIDLNLILAHVAPDRSDLRDSLDRLQRVLDEVSPVWTAAGPGPCPSGGWNQHVVVDLAERRGVGGQRRSDACPAIDPETVVSCSATRDRAQ